MLRRLSLSFLALACLFSLHAQDNTLNTWWNYIENYKAMAIDQMNRYGIPASITLAQGLCESGAGRSRLATEAHNHFGIKVGMNWSGPYMILPDDRPDDRFRVYRTDDESYEDHSRFLRNSPRYASLFELKMTDYKGWAHGLKRCGYATNPRYGDMLIGVIERYNLQQFDSYTKGKYHPKARNQQELRSENDFFSQHIVYLNNKIYMIIANSGDTWERVAYETGVSKRRLLQYNELPSDYQLQAGDLIYLQKKRQKADPVYKHQPHTVQPGESLYSISQRYGIRLSSLYKMNNLPDDCRIQVGDILRVR